MKRKRTRYLCRFCVLSAIDSAVDLALRSESYTTALFLLRFIFYTIVRGQLLKPYLNALALFQRLERPVLHVLRF